MQPPSPRVTHTRVKSENGMSFKSGFLPQQGKKCPHSPVISWRFKSLFYRGFAFTIATKSGRETKLQSVFPSKNSKNKKGEFENPTYWQPTRWSTCQTNALGSEEAWRVALATRRDAPVMRASLHPVPVLQFPRRPPPRYCAPVFRKLTRVKTQIW